MRLFTAGGDAFFTSDFTITMWAMAADTASIYTLFAVQTSATNELTVQIYLQITSGKMQSACANGTPVSLTTSSLAKNKWIMGYAYYTSGGSIKFGSYADGSF